MMAYCDAHNHLQDERFGGQQDALLSAARAAGVQRWVVNGSCESDWPDVQRLAAAHPGIVPSFGYHPWYLPERTEHWQSTLVHTLDTTTGAVIGEIGVDRWLPALSTDQRNHRFPALAGYEPATWVEQVEAFTWQWDLAARRHLPATVHCLQAWGPLRELLATAPRLDRGFLLHSYGGPAEMVEEFARLGAYFGFPGYFLLERKDRQREAFRKVPPERLLIETDAPDQRLPDDLNVYPLTDSRTGQPLNHPANLPKIYAELARHLGQPLPALTARVADNFTRLFGAREAATAPPPGSDSGACLPLTSAPAFPTV